MVKSVDTMQVLEKDVPNLVRVNGADLAVVFGYMNDLQSRGITPPGEVVTSLGSIKTSLSSERVTQPMEQITRPIAQPKDKLVVNIDSTRKASEVEERKDELNKMRLEGKFSRKIYEVYSDDPVRGIAILDTEELINRMRKAHKIYGDAVLDMDHQKLKNLLDYIDQI